MRNYQQKKKKKMKRETKESKKKSKDGIIKYVTNCIINLYYQSVVS